LYFITTDFIDKHISFLSLFDEKVEEEEKEDKLQEVIDDIRNKFGDSVIGFANVHF